MNIYFRPLITKHDIEKSHYECRLDPHIWASVATSTLIRSGFKWWKPKTWFLTDNMLRKESRRWGKVVNFAAAYGSVTDALGELQ